MSLFYRQMNSSATANQGGCFAARSASFFLMIAGIALAMSVLFCSAAALEVRLCLSVLVLLAEIIIIMVVLNQKSIHPQG